MKTIKVRKSTDFSENSKVYLYLGNRKIHLRGFESFNYQLNPSEGISASQQWARSKKISYDQIEDGSYYVIRPRLGKQVAFITLVILLICFAIFYFTRSRWSFLPLIPMLIYIGLYITILKDKYLIIDSFKMDQ